MNTPGSVVSSQVSILSRSVAAAELTPLIRPPLPHPLTGISTAFGTGIRMGRPDPRGSGILHLGKAAHR